MSNIIKIVAFVGDAVGAADKVVKVVEFDMVVSDSVISGIVVVERAVLIETVVVSKAVVCKGISQS